MERSISASSGTEQAAYHPSAETPPWERRTVAQVPYMRTQSPPLTETERDALPALWASQTTSHRQTHLGEHVRSGKGTNYGPSPISPAKDNERWTSKQPSTSHVPVSAGYPPMSQAPYESVRIPTAPKTAPTLPSFVRAPPSPPQSLQSHRSSTTSDKSRSRTASLPGPPPAPPALPGTMSTRSRTPSRHRSRSTRSDKVNHEKKSSTGGTPFGQRFKAGFKNMFKREPIDESQFERIDDRHWTDE